MRSVGSGSPHPRINKHMEGGEGECVEEWWSIGDVFARDHGSHSCRCPYTYIYIRRLQRFCPAKASHQGTCPTIKPSCSTLNSLGRLNRLLGGIEPPCFLRVFPCILRSETSTTTNSANISEIKTLTFHISCLWTLSSRLVRPHEARNMFF